MNTAELLAALREKLDDETAPHLWPDKTLVRYLNNAVREACLRARLLKDDETSCAALCRLPVVVGQAYVKYPAEILVVRDGRLASGSCEKLWALTAESMDRHRPGWQSTANSPSTPEVMVTDLAQKTLRLVPTPAVDDTLYLRVWRVPREQERLSLERKEREPLIQIPDPEELCHWAAYEAYMKHDSDNEDKSAAADHLKLFESRFGQRPTLHEMARWADSPPRIRYAGMF
jgi:hypothetical protein